MFDIGAPELFIVIVLAIIVVGPKDLPKMIRGIMDMVRKIRSMGRDFQNSIKQMADEVELDEVTRKLNEAGNIPLEEDLLDGDLDEDDKSIMPDILEEDTDDKTPEPPVKKSGSTDE